MSPSEYASHPFRPLLERVEALRSAPELVDPDVQSNEANSSAIESIFSTIAVVRAISDRTPAQLVSAHGLTQLQNAVQAIYNELSAFQSNKNPGHIQNAKAQIEQAVLPLLWAFGPSTLTFTPLDLAQAVETTSRTATDAIRELVSQRDALKEHQAALVQQVKDAESRLESLTDAMSKQRAEASSAVAQLQQQYAEKETERATLFEALVKQLQGDFAQFQQESQSAQSARLESLQESQQQAAQIVQAVGNTGITGNYQKIAVAEGLQANVWRGVTIVFFIGGIAIAGLTFWKFWHEPFSPETAWSVLIRLLYAIAITAPAWYAAKESARHRTNSDRARQTELELASLGPFIELMPEEKKNQIREELTKRYFGTQVPEHTASTPMSIKDVQEFTIEAIKAARK